MNFLERYTITEVLPEEGSRVYHVLDESMVSPTRAPKAASRYYHVSPGSLAGEYLITRDGGETRRATSETCDCPHAARGAVCIHRLIIWRILGQTARGRVPVTDDPWEGRS